MLSLKGLGTALLVAGVLAIQTCNAEEVQRVRVVEPFLELHTGPGRGYPVTQIVERGDTVEILQRKTDWFKVRTQQDRQGWVSREELQKTVTADGVPVRLRDEQVYDTHGRRLEIGFSGGQLDGDAIMLLRSGYRFLDNLTGELTIGQSSGDLSSSLLFYADLLSEPYPEKRLSPFFTLGLGRFKNTPKATLVNASVTRSNLANAGIGARYSLAPRLALRADYRRHLVFVDENRIDNYNELTLGITLYYY